MDVILNVESLTPPRTGIGNYTWALLRGLRGRSDVGHIACFNHARLAEPCAKDAVDLAVTPRPSRTRQRLRRILRAIPGAYPLRAALLDATFWGRTRALRHAVYHEPNYILKPFAGPCVATVHDLSHLHYPQHHPRERVRYLESRLPRTLARADHIITVSQFVAGELVSVLGVDPRRVSAIHLGVDGAYRPRTAAETGDTLARYGLDHGHYLLAVGTLEPRKNLLALVETHARLPTPVRRALPLALAGPPGWKSAALERRLDELERRGEVRRLGYLPAAELPLVYAGALGFVFPSVYEGFGLPVLEAMASGVPVLSSQRASLPEVVGEAGLLVDPEDPEALLLGLERLMGDEAFRDRARLAGPRRAAGFSWERCVSATVEIYRKVLAG